MNLYPSHITAFRIWRAWSAAHPIALSTFHDLRGLETSLLPFRHLPSASVMASCAYRDSDVRRLTSSLDAALAHALGPSPIHVLVGVNDGSRNSSRITRHRGSLHWPRHAFLEVAPHIFASSPEMTFVQMAGSLSFGEALALAYELCGCYPLPGSDPRPLVRPPLTTPARLTQFCDKLAGARGAKTARLAARFAQAKSASPMETELAVIASLPVRLGGFGINGTRLNEPIVLSPSTAKAVGVSRVVGDLFVPQAQIDVEYDGFSYHRDAYDQARDARKKDALALEDIELIAITAQQFRSITQTTGLMNRVRTRSGKRPCPTSLQHTEKHSALRHGMRKFHREHPYSDI